MNCCNLCDTLGVAEGRQGIPGIPGTSGITTLLLGYENIFVSKDGDDSTGTNRDLTKSFLTIKNAIIKAISLIPSSTNIINIIIYSGTYIEDISIPAYVNLISIIPSSLLFDISGYSIISSRFQNSLRPVYINGTITTIDDNITIIGINCDILAINNLSTNSQFSHIISSISITTDQSTLNGSFYDVHSESFLTTDCELSGYFEKCTALDYSFASGNSTAAGEISGNMIDCIGRFSCFSSSDSSSAGVISGNLIRCQGFLYSFSSSNTGTGGDIFGKLTNCFSPSYCYSSSQTNNAGNILGILIDCEAGDFSYSSGNNGGEIGGSLIRCIGASHCFSYGIIQAGELDGIFMDCIGGDYCYSSSTIGIAGIISSQQFNNCIANTFSFVSTNGGTAGNISGIIVDCIGQGICFSSNGGTGIGSAGIISGKLYHCLGGNFSFCSSTFTGGIISGQLIECKSDSNNIMVRATLTGKIVSISATPNVGSNLPAITVGNGAVIQYCKLKGDGTANSIHAGVAVNVSITFTSTFGKGINSNVTNLVTTGYNINDANEKF